MSIKTLASALLISLSVVAAAAADESISYARGLALMSKYNCQSCHSMDKDLAGPSLRDIAKKYASNPNARVELEAKVVNGSVGVWGPIPMPPTSVPEADLDTLLKWILSLKQ